MKVIAITPHEKHDFLAATVVEGLYRNGIEVIGTDYGNNLERVYKESEILSHSKDASCVFAFSSKKVDPPPQYHLLDKIDLPIVYIDGSEWTHTYHYDTQHQQSESLLDPSRRRGANWINREMYDRCTWYFKRECYVEDMQADKIYPLPFGIVSKNIHIGYQAIPKTIDVLCAFGQINTGLRAQVSKICREYRDLGHNVVIGNFPYELYIQKMKESVIVVDAWGSGDCNARFYEAVANGCCVMHQRPNIISPHPFQDKIHCVEFGDEIEFSQCMDYYLANIPEALEIGKSGQRHGLQYHTSKERVKYMLEEMGL